MPIQLTQAAADRLVAARKARRLTQQELASEAKVSLRTIQDLEKSRRANVYDTTLVLICRALEVPFDELVGAELPVPTEPETPPTLVDAEPGPKAKGLDWKLLAVGVGGAILVIGLMFAFRGGKSGSPAVVVDSTAKVIGEAEGINWRRPGKVEWKQFWEGKSGGVIFNELAFDRGVCVGDTVRGRVVWSYHYSASRPAAYANLFAEWAPNEETFLYSGALSGDSTVTCPFSFSAPKRPGIYRIRVFISPQMAATADFDGHQIKGPLIKNHLPRWTEAKVVVFPKRLRDKVVNER